MKHILLILTICLLPTSLWAGRHTYAEQSVLREGKVVKIRVSQTGVHAITYNELKDWGLQPDKVRVLGYGGTMLSENFTKHKWDDLPSVPFYMHKVLLAGSMPRANGIIRAIRIVIMVIIS